ncbi:MAG: sigma-54-dependent Fis family transcriptional regulator [Myxococcales bacterium]|nr:sigma-54-dependent Fis family transcriptional regulator [Myxococcales bacterium]
MVVEDDVEVGKLLARKLSADGHDHEILEDPRPVLERLDAGEDGWDVVILDVGLPGMSGIDVLRRFREAGSSASIIMLTGDNSAQTATTCMRAGAFYYLTKPFRPYELGAMVESAARYSTMRRQLAAARAPQPSGVDHSADRLLVGTSTAMRRLRSALDRLAGQDVSILIQGESGTGKELVARALHYRGMRRAKALRRPQLRRDPRVLDRQRAVPATRGAPSPAPPAIVRACSSRPMAAPCSSTRSATCRSPCKRGCCACCRRARSARSAAASSARSMFA